MAKRKGLPKKYARMGFKRGWAAYKKANRPVRTKTTKPVIRRRTTYMAKKKYYRKRATNFLTSKTTMDGILSAGGKVVVRKVLGGGPLYEAGVDLAIGFIRKNNTLIGSGIVNGITAFLPSLNIGSGTTGGVR
jgi:hypothetical protein